MSVPMEPKPTKIDDPSDTPSGGEVDLHLELTYDRRVNFAMQQNDVPVVKRLVVENRGSSPVTDLEIKISTEPPLSASFTCRTDVLAPSTAMVFDKIDLELLADRLVNVTEREKGELKIDVTSSGRPIKSAPFPIEILSYNEWNGNSSLPEILAAFVQPNHPGVDRLLSEACGILEISTGNPALSGYQSKDHERVRTQAAAIWGALAARRLSYVNPPASFESTGQKIRTPDGILDSGMGTCIDLALLLAAAWEQAGLNPIVVILEGHAIAGVWLTESHFPEPALADGLRIRKRVDLDELLVVECTALTHRPPHDFAAAALAGRRRLDDVSAVLWTVDIRAARLAHIRPIPPRINREGFVPTSGPEPVAPMPVPPAPLSGTTTLLVRVEDLDLGEAAPVVQLSSEESRIERWKRELLDLSLRNRLLNFRPTATSLELFRPNLVELENRLSGGRLMKVSGRPRVLGENDPRSAEIHQARTGEDPAEAAVRRKLEENIIACAASAEEVGRRLLSIHRAARTSREENGANTLYLALGFVSWFESPSASEARLAPILLLPLQLDRKSVRDGFRLKLADEDAQINVTLIRKLKDDFGVDVQGLEDLNDDDQGLDVKRILDRFRAAIVDLDRWEVVDAAHIGIFSFTKFLMWRDLEARRDVLLKNESVRRIVASRDLPPSNKRALFPDPTTFDHARPAGETFCVLDADSSQLGAVYAAVDGMSFVLEGPPGTGKSQTITNMIAQCLASGKSVLFVAEKLAALSVVEQRLRRQGLGAYVLELHSNKASKREVLAQFGETLDAQRSFDLASHAAEIERLEDSRAELNTYVQILHRRRACGSTLFEILGQLRLLNDAPHLETLFDDPLIANPVIVESARAALAVFSDAARGVGHLATHPLGAIGLEDWSPATQENLATAARRGFEAAGALSSATDRLAIEFGGWPKDPSRDDLDIIETLLRLLKELPGPCGVLLRETGWAHRRGEVDEWIRQGRAIEETRRRLFARYRPSFLQVPLSELIDTFEDSKRSLALVNFFKLRTPKSVIQRECLGEIPDSVDGLLADLRDARTLKDDIDRLRNLAADGARLFGGAWKQENTDWRQIERCIDWTSRARLQLSRLRRHAETDGFRELWTHAADEDHSNFNEGSPLGDAVRAFLAAYDSWISARKHVVESFLVSEPAAYGSSAAPAHLKTFQDRMKSWIDQCSELRSICACRRAAREAQKAGLTSLVKSFESGSISAEQLQKTFEHTWRRLYFKTLIERESDLRHFDRPTHEGKISRFRELDEKLMTLARTAVQARLAARLPQTGEVSAKTSEIGILQREIKKQRAHMPVRRLFERIPTLLPLMKPCLLMSPLSVAQYLDPQFPPFDLVVFDEASQIPVQDAIGALGRGHQAIIVGDSKQLPPTTFFMRYGMPDDAEPDEDDIEELESILDEAVAVGFPRHYLRWHYRSKHESLIEFSNRHYYEDKLFTFPAALHHAPDLGVSHVHVADGCFDRARTGTNSGEAKALVRELSRRFHANVKMQSFGLITMSLAQQQLVEDLVEEERTRDPIFDAAWLKAEAAEPVFIKNLENVQGDERDVIFLGVGYGPDVRGLVTMNFGPLNRAGGERRLNVAVTRARRELVVFSTILPEQIDLARTSSVGVAHLKSYLEFARSGRLPTRPSTGLPPAAPMEDDIVRRLEARGHKVARSVGRSAYRVDIGVFDPEEEGRFVLGIECDGQAYADAATARDRDRLRPAVLKSYGWQLTRVWSMDYWVDPNREILRLETEIHRAAALARAERESRAAALDVARKALAVEQAAAAAAAALPVQESHTERENTPPESVTNSISEPADGPRISDVPAIENPSLVAPTDTDRTLQIRVPMADIGDEESSRVTPIQSDTRPVDSAAAAITAGRATIYRHFSHTQRLGSSEDFFAETATTQVIDVLRQIVREEAPVSFARAVSLVLEAWNIKRSTKRAVDRILAALDLKKDPQNPSLINGFLWGPGQDSRSFEVFRVPATDSDFARSADEIPVEEIANAAGFVLEANISMDTEELYRETARLFGISRLGKTVLTAVSNGVSCLVDRGGCVIEGERVRLNQ